MKLTENDLVELAEIYNTSGKKALVEQLKEKQVKNISYTMKRLSSRNLITTEAQIDEKAIDVDKVFMSMDELCSPIVPKHIKTEEITLETKSIAMERMIQELIGDRLLELSKYITLNASDKLVIIDKTTLSADGYKMIVH